MLTFPKNFKQNDFIQCSWSISLYHRWVCSPCNIEWGINWTGFSTALWADGWSGSCVMWMPFLFCFKWEFITGNKSSWYSHIDRALSRSGTFESCSCDFHWSELWCFSSVVTVMDLTLLSVLNRIHLKILTTIHHLYPHVETLQLLNAESRII